MASLLKKKTKFNTNFIETNLYFLTEINKRLKDKNWTRESNESCVVAMVTDKYPYCWDSISLIQKRLSDNKWDVKMTNFQRSQNGYNSYTWRFSLKK